MDTKILFPTGRQVGGDLYTPQTKDLDGRPLVIKSGPNVGQPTVRYWFPVAYRKTPGVVHFGNEPGWGQELWAAGCTAFPNGQTQLETFSWKVVDGDSTKPGQPSARNPQGKRPCDNEGYPGHWVVSFQSTFAPKIVSADGSAPMIEKDAVKPGDFIQVYATVAGNDQIQKPGMFINHSLVSFQGYGERITWGVDPRSVGFGKGALPPGASAIPIGQLVVPAALPPGAVPGPPPSPSYAPPSALPPHVRPPMTAQMPAMAPTAVMPSTSFIRPPGAGMAPGIPPAAAPALPPVRLTPAQRMTAKAAGVPYENFIAQNWTEALMVQHGYMMDANGIP